MTLEEMIAQQKAKNQQTQNVQQPQQQMEQHQAQNTQQFQNTQVAAAYQDKQETYEDEQKSMTQSAQSTIDASMFIGTVSSKFVKPYIQEDVYNAVVESIDLKHNLKDFVTGELKDKFLWTFKLSTDSAGNAITEDANGKSLDREIKLSVFTNIAWGMKSTNYKMYSKIMNHEPQKDEKYNILDCIGKKCRVNVATKKPENGLPYSTINSVMMAKN